MPSRREFLGAALSGATAVVVPVATAETFHGAASINASLQNDDDLDRLLPQLSNWGRWGRMTSSAR